MVEDKLFGSDNFRFLFADLAGFPSLFRLHLSAACFGPCPPYGR